MAQLWRAQVISGSPIWGAVNGDGTGVTAPAITSITPAATSAAVAWTGTATHYRINGGGALAMPDGTSPDTITGLTVNTEYSAPGLQLSGDGGATWSAAVTFGTLNPGAGGGAIGTEYSLQASAGLCTAAGASASMSYSPPGAVIYSLVAAAAAVAAATSSAAMLYTPPASGGSLQATAKPTGRRLSTAIRE
jgi:hypothetical protein